LGKILSPWEGIFSSAKWSQLEIIGRVVSSRDEIFYVGPSMHTWGYGKFVIACYTRFTNSNAKLRLCLCLHLDFLPSLLLGKKPEIALVRLSGPT